MAAHRSTYPAHRTRPSDVKPRTGQDYFALPQGPGPRSLKAITERIGSITDSSCETPLMEMISPLNGNDIGHYRRQKLCRSSRVRSTSICSDVTSPALDLHYKPL